MILFRRLLAHIGDIGVAGAQIVVDPRHEQHQQHRHQQETDQAALHIEAQQSILAVGRQVQRPVEYAKAGETQTGDADQRPGVDGGQKHRAEHDLQQIEGHERIGRAAGEEKLPRQGRDIGQQGQHEFLIRDGVPALRQRDADQIDQGQAGGCDQQPEDRQADAHDKMDQQYGGDLTGDRQPAQLDQQAKISPVRGFLRHRRLAPVADAQQALKRLGHCADRRRRTSRATSQKPTRVIRAMPNQVRA